MTFTLTADYHTHTPYSHGKNTVYENALVAKEKGLKEIGISDHGYSHIFFGLRRRRVPALRAEIEEAKEKLGINVLLGIESNLISLDGKTDMRESDYVNHDLFLCGIHNFPLYPTPKDAYYIMFRNYVATRRGKTPSEKVIENTTKAYVNAVKKNPIDAITHVNYTCFCDLLEVAKCCSDYGTYLEINTKKHHITAEELNMIAAKTDVRFIIDSDAHTADRVGDTKIAEELLAEADIPLERIDNIDGRLPSFRFAEYKKRNL